MMKKGRVETRPFRAAYASELVSEFKVGDVLSLIQELLAIFEPVTQHTEQAYVDIIVGEPFAPERFGKFVDSMP
jgi:hypothetical protein